MELSKDIDLLLIGKTGNGKSALGNTILRRNNMFLSRNCQTSVTKDIQTEVSAFNNRIIKVVDGPGVGDTCLDKEGAVNLVMKAMQFAISANPRGYHAFLLVTKFGGRFTEEDKETILFLKRIFGENFVKNHCILVLTCGDNFESDENNSTFEEWCNEQIGVFKDLLEECCRRVVLFDNRTKAEDKKEKQLSNLIEMVDNLRWRDLRYTDENFQKAREARDKLMVEAKMPMVHEETMNEISLIIQKLQWTQENVDHRERRSHLEDFQKRATTLYDNIQEKDKGTGALHEILKTVNSIQVTIANEIEISQRVIEEREKMRKEEEERTQTFMAELARQRKEYEQRLTKDKIEDERRSKLLEEYEKKLRDLTEKMDTDRANREKEFEKPFEEESKLQRKQLEDIETQYKAARRTNDKGFFSSLAESISWSFKKLFGSED